MTTPIMRYFTHQHLRHPAAKIVSQGSGDLARLMNDFLPNGPEKSAGLRKLLEAKDCFVRSALELPNTEETTP